VAIGVNLEIYQKISLRTQIMLIIVMVGKAGPTSSAPAESPEARSLNSVPVSKFYNLFQGSALTR
jgi:hypothetical protein